MQMMTMARAWPGHNQEPGASSQTSTWAAVAQALGPFSDAFPRLLAGRWIGSGTAGTETGTHMRCNLAS